ncbi:predicted protein [Thalassiosira pseudonana CCMP1335]|uniref:FCP1 homology domain-containing protein n=1 Tax=Thalassiosira pseudonana TaxID=35128 RepID=B8CB40_THAPS|nr:predicted protein [Thalassiosira pseudonana CCMP1335]EED89063.1 predicted protein [Thalassiosira pseudonana CCMP1335]|eukprot:g13024.t1 g13024   contig7:703870-704517(-)
MSLRATSRDEKLQKRCSAAVQKLVDLKINFLAIDFDQTLVDVHTGGRWKGTTQELVQHMRPLFLRLVPLASQHNIRVAIVTFSRQTERIREVLELSYPDYADVIPIRGCDNTWEYKGSGMRMGKQEHMASVSEELIAKPAMGVTDVRKDTTLLIDDDPRNIRLSLKDGTRAVWFNPMDPERLLDNILLLM